MRSRLSFRALTVALPVAIASNAFAQGSLTPPGAPATTMKTLDQVEARTPIPGGTAPFLISAPGSYYLTGNLQVSGADAITVNASGVTVDLNGFTISSTASPAAGTAVLIPSGRVTVAVRNGHIFGPGTVNPTTGAFSGGGFANGVRYAAVGASDPGDGLSAYDLTITGCGNDGINFLTSGVAASSVAERCAVRHVGHLGITASTLRSCSVFECGFAGMVSVVASDCVALVRGSGPGLGIQGTTVTNCTASTSGTGVGLIASNATNCYGYSMGGTGLSATTAVGCQGGTVSGLYGISASEATHCEARVDGNAGTAALSTSTATGCVGAYNGNNSGLGISALLVVNSVGYSATGDGIRASAVDACSGRSGGSGTGISTDSAQNSQAFSASGIGLTANRAATGCYGETTSANNAGLFTSVALNCSGKNNGNGLGLQAVNAATNSFGVSLGGTGLRTPAATTCFGQSSAGTASPALFAISATNCRGWQTTGAGVAIQTDIAFACTSQAGTIVCPSATRLLTP